MKKEWPQLAESWQEVLRRKKGTAIFDQSSGEEISFAQLDKLARADESDLPQSFNINFIIKLLHSWYSGESFLLAEKEDELLLSPCQALQDFVVVKKAVDAVGEMNYIFFTEAQILADTDRIFSQILHDKSFLNVAAVSLAHSYGFVNNALLLLLRGLPLYILANPLPSSLETFCATNPQNAMISAAPIMWRIWNDADVLRTLPKAENTLALSAGAPFGADLENDIFIKNGLKVRNFYGSSECGGIACDLSSQIRKDSASVGKVMHGVKFRLDQRSHVCVGGESLASGRVFNLHAYLNGDEEMRLYADEFCLPDIGETRGGVLLLHACASEAINVAGRKISPAHIEHRAMTLAQVLEACAFGIPSKLTERTQETALFLRLQPGVKIGEVKREIAALLETWELPRVWRLMPADVHGNRKFWQQFFIEQVTNYRNI